MIQTDICGSQIVLFISSNICCRAKTCYKRVPHSQVFKNRKWTYGLQSKHTFETSTLP